MCTTKGRLRRSSAFGSTPGFGDLLAYEDWHRIAPDAASRDECAPSARRGP